VQFVAVSGTSVTASTENVLAVKAHVKDACLFWSQIRRAFVAFASMLGTIVSFQKHVSSFKISVVAWIHVALVHVPRMCLALSPRYQHACYVQGPTV